MTTTHERFSSAAQVSFLLTLILTLTSLLTSCAFPIQSDQEQNTDGSLTPGLEIQFSLQLPAPLNEDEKVIFEILDEVTGLPYNIQQYDMDTVAEDKYSLSLSFPIGSVIKYRYVKVSDGFSSPEVQYDGEAIRYRLFSVRDTVAVTDILHCWQGETASSSGGIFSGVIYDDQTGQPIPDIIVSAGGQLTFSDANGKFVLSNLAPGIHNAVFYAIDGSYRTYQQGAMITGGLITPGVVKLTPMPLVNLTFTVTAPNDALGAPIYMAGNLTQLGNTFSDPAGGMSINPKLMPALTQQEDGTYTLNLQLYAETDLRYKFTLGDGYWNAEQKAKGGFRIRQLIVPDSDTTVDVQIDSWRTADVGPVTFKISIPLETAPNDEKFIEFKTDEWTSPIPLWPLGSGDYLYILFSPLDTSLPISYRFCRNQDCENALNAEAASYDLSVLPSKDSQTEMATLSAWEHWQAADQPAETNADNIPVKSDDFVTSVELSPEMDTTWLSYASIGLAEAVEIGIKNVIFSPQWFVQTDSAVVHPEMGSTPFYQGLSYLLDTSQSLGLTVSMFPQIGPTDEIGTWWMSQSHSTSWWQEWFESYKLFILNYAKIAQDNDVNELIIGGTATLPTFTAGIYPDGSDTDAPASADETWQELIASIREVYSGNLIWATNIHTEADPLPDFINSFDGIYISVDSPLAQSSNPTAEDIKAGFTEIIDYYIYEIYRSTEKPITLALAYPSVNHAAQGCSLLNETCYNDGLFLMDEISSSSVDLDEQTLIYESIIPTIASRDWITGISIRGYAPTVVLQDGSSSIFGKPSMDIIRLWFSGLIGK